MFDQYEWKLISNLHYIATLPPINCSLVINGIIISKYGIIIEWNGYFTIHRLNMYANVSFRHL